MTGDASFDVDVFLARPLVARVAAAGPSVRPVWFLWEDNAFWWITGAYARLPEILAGDSRLALVVDSCDLDTGEVRQVTACGEGVVVPFDPERARRKARALPRAGRSRLKHSLQCAVPQRARRGDAPRPPRTRAADRQRLVLLGEWLNEPTTVFDDSELLR